MSEIDELEKIADAVDCHGNFRDRPATTHGAPKFFRRRRITQVLEAARPSPRRKPPITLSHRGG